MEDGKTKITMTMMKTNMVTIITIIREELEYH